MNPSPSREQHVRFRIDISGSADTLSWAITDWAKRSGQEDKLTICGIDTGKRIMPHFATREGASLTIECPPSLVHQLRSTFGSSITQVERIEAARTGAP